MLEDYFVRELKHFQDFDVDQTIDEMRIRLKNEGREESEVWPRMVGKLECYFSNARRLAVELFEENQRLHKLLEKD